jgi:hypothetical protein
LMVVHGEEELLHELYLVLLRPVLEVVQAHAPANGSKTADQGWGGGVPEVRKRPCRTIMSLTSKSRNLSEIPAISGPKKVSSFRAHPCQGRSKRICPRQNHNVPRLPNNRYIKSYFTVFHNPPATKTLETLKEPPKS